MHVEELWRHPVKSVPGERVDRVTVTVDGAVGDRAWGLRDVATGAVLSAKRDPRLLLLSAHLGGEGVIVAIPGVREAADDASLSEWLGRAVHLDRTHASAYVDEAPLHLLARAELGTWDVRRFRPNLVVGGVDSLDELVGERLRVGPVEVEVYSRTKRCAMPTMAQSGTLGAPLTKDVDILRALARGRELRLGVYARVVTPGVVETGAPVELV